MGAEGVDGGGVRLAGAIRAAVDGETQPLAQLARDGVDVRARRVAEAGGEAGHGEARFDGEVDGDGVVHVGEGQAERGVGVDEEAGRHAAF